MKQISAILIACFLFIGVSQVSAQQMLTNIRYVSQDNYLVGPTDTCVWLENQDNPSICRLPAASSCKGRIVQIVNRRNQKVTISHPRTGVVYPALTLPYNASVMMVSDGNVWFVHNKSY